MLWELTLPRCENVTIVGDRGMIKSTRIKDLPDDFHYITAITKPQIDSLMKKGVMQIGLFDKNICEIEDNGIRYILRRNPARALEVQEILLSKQRSPENFIQKKNGYLKEQRKIFEK
jgi:hypothetical protein